MIESARCPGFFLKHSGLNTPDQQTAKTSPFIEALTLADDQLRK